MSFQTVRGMRDLIGQDALIQEAIEARFRRVFAKYGYLPLYTPAVENFDLFKVKGAAGEAIKDEIYYFKDKSERELGLRFEFTASLARVAASEQLKMPFKRYQIGEVYRYDRPQAKRYRAFTQADIDILGIEGLEAELEVMLIVRDCFSSLGLKPKVIFNSRKLLNDIFEKYAKGKEKEAMRILDKLDKIGKENVYAMLKEEKIDTKVLELIEKNDIEKITQILGQTSGIKEVEDFNKKCKENKLNFVEFNSSLARGLDYYTGLVFEIKLDNGPSVGGGGRFDKLISNYGGKKTPAVGIGLGVSRIFDYLKEKGFKVSLDGLFLTGINIEEKELNKIASMLRENEIPCEVDLKGMNIGKAFDYAEKKGYTFVGLIGENELKSGAITIKNLKTGKQENVKVDVKEINKILTK